MGVFKSAVLTAQGNDLLTSAVAGRQIEFTRLVTGSGVFTDDEKERSSLEKMTALKAQRQEFTFSTWEKQSETSVLLTALITNRELSESYKMTEIGIYGREVGADTDILCSIAVTENMDVTDTFPAYNGLRETQIIQDYYITVSADADVTVNTQGAAALAEDLEALRENLYTQISIIKNTRHVFVGPIETQIENGDVLLIADIDGESPDPPTPSGEFLAAAPTNMVISAQAPTDGTPNWGIIEGTLTIGSTPEEDTTFFGQV
ncbi:MAG: hypothetical protein Q4C60_07475 [Eubacteriales bacterium]|nr:hypothetical protein [Eubacteriales bacterium]